MSGKRGGLPEGLTMPAELSGSSVVLVAHDVNISIFKPLWLERQGILSGDELSGNFVITPPCVRIPTDRFELLVLPDRIQLRPDKESTQVQDDVMRVLGGIVSTLPHTPFTAVGLNFEFRIALDEGSKFAAWNKSCFASQYSVDTVGDHVDNARFGTYFSFDVLGMRLKANLAPVTVSEGAYGDPKPPTGGREAMLGTFNFHRDLTQPVKTADILETLGRWDKAGPLAAQLAQGACAFG